MKILNTYIILEFIPQFFLSLTVFTFILLMDKIFSLINLILTKGVSIINVIKLFLYTLPSILSLTIPMAFLMGTLLALGRLAEDNEITALRASGIPQRKILYPILILATLACIGLMFFNQRIAPMTQKLFSKTYYNIIYDSPTLNLEENSFTTISNYKIFIKKIDRKNNTLKNVIIYKMDKQEEYPLLITAKNGLIKQEGSSLNLLLLNGIIQKKDIKDKTKFNQIKFSNYRMKFDIEKKTEGHKDFSRSIVNMTGKELKTEYAKLKESKIPTNNIVVQYHLRFSVAFACITFVLLAMPLSVTTPRHGKTIAFGMSLILIFIFYMLLASGINLGEKGIIEPRIALWMPNIVLGIIGIYIFNKVNKK